MKLFRFRNSQNQVRVGLIDANEAWIDLTAAGMEDTRSLLENEEHRAFVAKLVGQNLPRVAPAQVQLVTPVERQEVWAAGVTYLRSKTARMEESDFSASAYDRVYEAERPELFFKALPEKVVGPDEAVGIRQDARWSVPEPELALVINSRGQIVGYTIGNDMSSRDIEGENSLYLPQAKIYHRSCAIGPWITVGATEAEARTWTIQLAIERRGEVVFQGETSAGQIKRSFEELVGFLFRSQVFANGVVLLTGTGVVPPDQFTLQPDDLVRIHVSGIGTLANRVTVV